MTGHLIAEEGPLAGMVIVLDEENQWILGRDADVCFQTLEDPMVSRKHVCIRQSEGEGSDGYTVENLSTVNPAQINGQPIEGQAPISEGDTLQIGNTLFRFTEKAPTKALPGEAEKKAPEPKPFKGSTSPLDKLSLMSTINTRWAIKVISGPNTGGEFNIQEGGTYVIGKDAAACDIVFHDMSVSKEHAKLTMQEDGSLLIEDLQSKNGIFVNSKAVEGSQKLENQDLVAIGTTSFLAIDREAAHETVYTPPPERPASEESAPEEASEAKPDGWKQMRISSNYLIVGAAILAIVVFGIGSVISLFKATPIHTEIVNESAKVASVIEEYPGVEYTYTETTGKLFLAGHVLTSVDKQELVYMLQTIPFITSIEDNVVVDEVISSDINALLSRNPVWRGVVVTATKPGHFVVKGYLRNQEEAAGLTDYLNLNFNYLDMLENEVVVEVTLDTEVRSMLIEEGFLGVTFQLTNGELVLAGRANRRDERRFEKVTNELKALRGVRQVKNFVIITTEATERIDITSQFTVTGSSRFGNASQFVLINGRILGVGDRLDGMKITEIKSNEVLLEKDGLKYRINYNVQ